VKKNFLKILNIGLDRDLLIKSVDAETQERQVYYSQKLPAEITHIVKATRNTVALPIKISENVTAMPCPVRHWIQFVPEAIRMGTQMLKRESVDLIQVQEPFVSGLIGIWLAKRFNLPLVVGLYSDEIDNPAWLGERAINRLANIIGKKILKSANAVRCDSLAVKNRLQRSGFTNINYIPFMITNAKKLLADSPRAEKLRQHLLGGYHGPLLLAVCRLEEEKNIPLMLSAFAQAVKQEKELVLAIAGHGSMAEAMRIEADRMVPGRVRWLGWIDNAEMTHYYQAADIMILSSNHESAARVLFESLLAGTPVLSTDTAGAREVIEEAKTGWVVPVGNNQTFAAALIHACSDTSRLHRMGETGRRSMELRVSGDIVIEHMKLMYDSIR